MINQMKDSAETKETGEVSKSQRKRDAQAAQDLGRQLLDLPESAWKDLALPDMLVAALTEAKRIHAHGALKRQMQYIGKLMRDVDPEPVEAWLRDLEFSRNRDAERHHELEVLRERLLEEGEAGVETLRHDHPDFDEKKVRQLIRQAQTERERGLSPKAARLLFRYLRDEL